MKKSKITLIIAAACFISGNIAAQAFIKGTNTLNAGIGIGGHFGGYSTSSQSPGISVSFEHGMWEVEGAGVISIGAYAGIKSYKYEQSYSNTHWNGTAFVPYTYKTSSKWSYTIIGARSAFHYNEIGGDNFDLYGGLLLSYNILSYKYTDDDPYFDYQSSASYGSVVGLTAFIGARYFFIERVGAFAEIGYGVSYLTIGASVKF